MVQVISAYGMTKMKSGQIKERDVNRKRSGEDTRRETHGHEFNSKDKKSLLTYEFKYHFSLT